MFRGHERDAVLAVHLDSVLRRHVVDRSHKRHVVLRHGDGLRLWRAHEGVARGLEPGHELGVHRAAAQRGLGVGAVLELHLVGVHDFLHVTLGSESHFFGEILCRRTHLQRLGELAVSLDDAALAVTLQRALGQVLHHALVAARADQALLYLGASSAGTVHHHVEHARHVGAGLARVAGRLARVLAELSLLAAVLTASHLIPVVGNAGRVGASALSGVSAGQLLAADASAVHLLAVAWCCDHGVTAHTHALAGHGAGRTGSEVAEVVLGHVTARARLAARMRAEWRLRAAGQRRLETRLAAGAGDGCGDDVPAVHAVARVAGQVARVDAAVEQLAADAVAHVEGAVRLLSLVRAAHLLALVSLAVQLRLADARADKRRAHLRLLLLAHAHRRRSTRHARSLPLQVVHDPARHVTLRERAATLLLAGHLAGRTGTRVALQRAGVLAAGQQLATHLAAAREGVGARLPVRVDLLGEVLAARTRGRLRVRRGGRDYLGDREGTVAAVAGVADVVAAVTLTHQHLAADATTGVAADARFTHGEQFEGLLCLLRRVLCRLFLLHLTPLFLFALVIAQVTQPVQVADHTRVVDRRLDHALVHARHRRDQQVLVVVRVARADRHLRLAAGHLLVLRAAVALAVHGNGARRTLARVTHQLARVLLAVQQLAADLVAVDGRGVRAAAHRLPTGQSPLQVVLRLAALAGQLDDNRAGRTRTRVARTAARVSAGAAAQVSAELAAAVRNGVVDVVLHHVLVARVDHAVPAEAPGEDRANLLLAATEGALRHDRLHALVVEIAQELYHHHSTRIAHLTDRAPAWESTPASPCPGT